MTTREVQASAVFGVPAYIVGNKLKDISSIKSFGKNKVVSCCIVENCIPSTTVGCIRRCTLSLKCFEGALLREKVISIKSGENKTETILQYIPCGESEMCRSPFGPHATFRIRDAITTYAVHTVTNSVNRCYVEFNTKLQLNPNEHGDEEEEKVFGEAIIYFWTSYLENLLRSLEAEVLAEAFPVLSGKIDTEFRNAYEKKENLFCEWAASSALQFPRQEVLDNFESVLICWSRVLQEYRHQKLVAETIRADVDGSKQVAMESAKQLATSEATLRVMMKKVEELTEAPCFYRPTDSNGDAGSGQSARLPPHVAASRERQFFHKASAGDDAALCLPAEDATQCGQGEGYLPTSNQESFSPSQKSVALLKNVHSSPPPSFSTVLLRNLFTENGELNEPQVEVLFRSLAHKSQNFVTSDEVKCILLSMDHIGLYEDQDGTLDELERCRESTKETYATRYSRHHFPSSMDTDISASAQKIISDESASSALSRLVKRCGEFKESRRENAMKRLAEDTVSRFCFRESSRLYFDEFCLAIIHLLKF